MDYKDLINRIATSLILILFFSSIIIFYDKFLKYFAYLIYLIIFFELILFFKKNIYILLISLIYLLFSLLCLELYFKNYYLKEVFIFTIILVVIFDISSYFFGTLFGRLKILPIISPNKTYFGLFSGFLITLILALIFNYYFAISINNLIIYIIFTLIFSFFGDIIESVFKRKSNIKNSSLILPGHGGFFDRFDSLIMVFIWMFLFNFIIN